MKTLGIFLIVFAAFGGGAYLSKYLSESRAIQAPAANDGIHWETSVEKSLKEAGDRKMPLFMDFYADWCDYCKQMDETTYRNPLVVSLSRHFVAVKLNIDKHPDLAQYFNVNGLPTMIFVDPVSKTAKRLEGYVPASDMEKAMTEAAKMQ